MKIEFDRYKIQPIELSDTFRFFNFVDKNRKRIRRFFPITSTTCKDVESTKTHIAKKIEQRENQEFYFYKITEQNAEKIIGCLILKSRSFTSDSSTTPELTTAATLSNSTSFACT